MGHSVAAPILVSGKLICQVPRYGQPNAEQAAADPAKGPAELQAAEKGPGTSVEVDDEAPDETTDRHESRRQVLKAWDAETGQEAWTSGDYKLEHFGNRYDADAIASPHPMRLTDGSNSVDVVVTTAGHVFRADDGRRLLENAAVANDPAPTPISDGKDVIYFMRQDYGGHSGRFGRATAVRLVLRGRDRVEAVVLWNRVFQGQNFGGFLLNGGVLHAYPGYREPFGAVVRLDAATGTRLNAVDFVARHQHGEGYAAPVAAGGVMVVGDTGRSDRNRFLVWKNPQLPPEERQPLLPGNMTTLLAGPDGFVLARNDMDGISLSPAIDEGRLFVRCRNALVCLGTTGAEGERYEAEQVAATLLTQLPPAPSDGPVVEPKAQSQLPSQYVPEDLPIGIPVCRWACVGPLTPSERDPAAKAIEFPVGARCIGDRTRRAEVCEIRQFDRPSAYPSDFLTENQAFGLRLDLARVHQGKAGTAALWTTVLRNDRRRVLRLELDGAPAKFWIGGTAVANGTRVRLTHGDYLLAMETALADGTPKEVPLRVCFWPSDDLERERAARQAAVQRLRPYFERAARLVPATDGGRRAADALAGL
jgi:hypothetical protein